MTPLKKKFLNIIKDSSFPLVQQAMEDFNLKNEAPKLLSLKKKNIYQVPDGFFKELEKDIRSNCARKPGRLRKLKHWLELSAAAAIVILALFSGIKVMADKKYVPVETDRTIYNITDGDLDKDQTINSY